MPQRLSPSKGKVQFLDHLPCTMPSHHEKVRRGGGFAWTSRLFRWGNSDFLRFPKGINQHISTSAHQHISTSAHQHISTSAHQHISTSAHQHISTSAHQHISTSAHQHISTSAHQHISTSAHQHISTSAHQHISTSAHQHISTSAHQHILNNSSFSSAHFERFCNICPWLSRLSLSARSPHPKPTHNPGAGASPTPSSTSHCSGAFLARHETATPLRKFLSHLRSPFPKAEPTSFPFDRRSPSKRQPPLPPHSKGADLPCQRPDSNLERAPIPGAGLRPRQSPTGATPCVRDLHPLHFSLPNQSITLPFPVLLLWTRGAPHQKHLKQESAAALRSVTISGHLQATTSDTIVFLANLFFPLTSNAPSSASTFSRTRRRRLALSSSPKHRSGQHRQLPSAVAGASRESTEVSRR